MEIPATFKQHPYAWGGGAAALIVLWLYARSSSSSSASQGTAVVSSTLDPTAAALTAQQMQDNVALTTASLQAQTQDNALAAATQINQSNNAAAVQLGSINANVLNAQTAASIFGTAANAELSSAALATTTDNYANYGNAAGNYVIGQGNEFLDPSQAIAAGFTPHSGQNVPVYTPTVNNAPATNATSDQLEEMFNNVIRAGQGTAPMQTDILQPAESTSLVQTGTAHIDPVFAVWDGSSAVPTITDVTLNGQSQYGYTGSVYNPASGGAAVNITPNAVPAATTASLPKLTLPPAFNLPQF